MKQHNFGAGPGILPQSVLQEAAQAVLDFNHQGLSLLEISHRSKPFVAVLDEAEALVLRLLGLSAEEYGVLFLTGGASTQFFMVPMNLLNEDETACYTDTGTWASNAIKEAKAFGQVEVLGSSKADNYNHLPEMKAIPAGAKYFHFTSNNTIFGTQYHDYPEVPAGTLLISDMSSDIFSRDFEASKFDLIYAGAQKNAGPAGTTLVIVRKSILGTIKRHLPSMLDYRLHLKNQSSYNTPPVFPIYVTMLNLRWIEAQGGLKAMRRRNQAKAEALYAEVDRNPYFKGTTAVKDRSWMNATFVTEDPEHEALFEAYCEANGIHGIKGHRSVGGFRASMYNALPLESVQYLVEVMQNFKP